MESESEDMIAILCYWVGISIRYRPFLIEEAASPTRKHHGQLELEFEDGVKGITWRLSHIAKASVCMPQHT